MKRFAILLTLIAAFALAGCGSDNKPAAAPTQTPQAAPAQKVENKDNVQYNEKGERVFSSKNGKYKDAKIGGTGGQVHQFKEK